MPRRQKASSNRPDRRGLIEGYRSGLEDDVAAQLRNAGIDAEYEPEKIAYDQPQKHRTYTPDFRLPNGIYIETKGRFVTADRQKHLLVKEQHTSMDLRFVFSNSRGRLSKLSKTTYGDWCHKHGFKYADKTIPLAWLHEPKR